MRHARPTMVTLVVTTALAVAPAALAAKQEAGLVAGIRQVEEGDFEAAVATLGPVADRLAAQGGGDAARACLYLGIAHLALDQRGEALARFEQALGHEPSLRLDARSYSPKVLAAFEEAQRAREAKARSAPAAGATAPEPSRGARTALIAGGAVAVGVGIALAAGGGENPPPPDGALSFTGARFGTPVLECPNGTAGTPLPVAIDLNAQNGGASDVTLGAVSAVLVIVASPVVPGEVGFASNAPATVTSATLRPGTTALRVQTTLSCGNGEGDASRFNEWKGRVTLTAGAAYMVETVDTMRVNLP